MTETIAAIATAIAIGQGSVAIIRISGKEALNIVKTISYFYSYPSWQTHRILYGWIQDPNSKKFIDEVLILVMLAPRSYTSEDVIEIQCHGGIITAKRILEVVLQQGARIAQPGEFTLRAFLNGRLDLSQAESILTMINAKSEKVANLAANNLKGKITKNIKYLKSTCLEILSNIEFKIDFEEENPNHEFNNIEHRIKYLIDSIEEILSKGANSYTLTNGVNICLLGRPNVGKSSLLNVLAQEDKSIVTHIPGTTRDIIEAELLLEGIPIKLVDTAGLQNTHELIEQIGIVKAQDAARKADLILLVLDVEKDWSQEEEEITEKLQNLPTLILINKVDLQSTPEKHIKFLPRNYTKKENLILTSTKNYYGIEALKTAIVKLIQEKILQNQAASDLLLNERQTSKFLNTKQSLEKVLHAIKYQYPCDFWSIDLRKAINSLEELTGEEVDEIILNTIFSKFCIGK
uniref:Thiophen and furan oxidation protein n=1 Tax=Sciadococcus taiwanensis TaxID=3028030 RepID=A0A9Y1MWM3_9RHOD|nr:thiophen and furan oxidation protein [Sciadococcus taiwanensis]